MHAMFVSCIIRCNYMYEGTESAESSTVRVLSLEYSFYGDGGGLRLRNPSEISLNVAQFAQY